MLTIRLHLAPEIKNEWSHTSTFLVCLYRVEGYKFAFIFREGKLFCDRTNTYTGTVNYAVGKEAFCS